MIDALIFLVDTLLTLYLYLLILRFVMQLVRVDFRNQIAHFVLIVTNPIIMPLRRILPPVGKIDTASVIAILLVAALLIAALAQLDRHTVLGPGSSVYASGNTAISSALSFGVILFWLVLQKFLYFFIGALVIYAILSWVVPAGYNPTMAILGAICEPVLRPFRRLIPPIGGIDLSVLWAMLALGVLLRLFHFV
jgi:YggT family protein